MAAARKRFGRTAAVTAAAAVAALVPMTFAMSGESGSTGHESAAFVSETAVDRGDETWWSGRFRAHLELADGSEVVEGPSNVTGEEALAWARSKAKRIVVDVGDTRFEAGAISGRHPRWGGVWPDGARPLPRYRKANTHAAWEARVLLTFQTSRVAKASLEPVTETIRERVQSIAGVEHVTAVIAGSTIRVDVWTSGKSPENAVTEALEPVMAEPPAGMRDLSVIVRRR